MQLIELGPGRGTLTQDVLRVLSKFGLTSTDFSVHLVEISPHQSEMQSRRLCFQTNRTPADAKVGGHYRDGETVSGIPVRWYERIQDVPNGAFSILLAHEFFDALPIHKFQKVGDDGDQRRWAELVIELDESGDHFRMVTGRTESPWLALFEQTIEPNDAREHIERSFETLQMIEHISLRLEQYGGFALLMDYGHMGDKTDTFRAFKQHKLHDPMCDPGTADLTADVDFAVIKRFAERDDRLCTFGPVLQRDFLQRMGGDARLQQLIDGSAHDPDAVASLRSGYDMLTKTMGERFKFFAMFPAVLRDHLTRFPVGGFK